nr:vomeronasal type-1 receptor 4-like [Vicugna pacos]
MSFHTDGLRIVGEVAVKTIFQLQMIAGAQANVILFFCNISPVLLGHKQRPTHVILTHMAVSNLLVLLSSRIPYTMAAFVLRNPLSSLGCKSVYYIHRVARSTTLCSTCVLSTYQFFTLNPRRVEWTMLRGRAPKLIGPSCCTCWIFSVLLNVYIPVTVTGPLDMKNDTDTQGKWFCSSSGHHTNLVILWSISDVMFISLLIWSSGSMMLLLHRHQLKMQCIHIPTGYHRCPPEIRATHTILMIVVSFVISYVLNSIFTLYILVHLNYKLWLQQICHVLASCFPTFSPFLLLLRDPRFPRFCS